MDNITCSLSPAAPTLPLVLPLALLGLLSVATAQTIDYPSSTLANPPQTAFPFYTPGGGSTGQTVRMQWLCPATFLAQQNLPAGLVTHIGFSLAGQAVYDVFQLRAGATTVASLGSDWTINLPDQRIQKDLSNQNLVGGGTAGQPVNQWVELELDQPFYWQPGEGVVVDLMTHIAVAGSYVGTTSGPGVQRAYNFNYSTGAAATGFAGAGGAFRMVFASTDVVTYGSGCIGAAGVAPSLSSIGAASLGGTMIVLADSVLDNTIGGFAFGFSRNIYSGGTLPAAFGGGCQLLVSPDAFVLQVVPPNGGAPTTASAALVVPVDAGLRGLVIYTQYVQWDVGTPATVPVTFSNGGAIVVF